MQSIVLLIHIAIILSGAAALETNRENQEIEADEYYTCPDERYCASCSLDWNKPVISEESVPIDVDLCNVTLYWDWPYVQNDQVYSPKMHYICTYGDGALCSDEIYMCASCKNVTFPYIRPSLYPVISYSDSCNYDELFIVGENCQLLSTIPITTTTTPVPTTINTQTTTVSPTTTTTFIPTTTTTAFTTHAPDGTTTDSGGSCPRLASKCFGCPSDWILGEYRINGTLTTTGTCDIRFSWDWDYERGTVDDPKMTFLCIYGTNGIYCQREQKLCTSCKEVWFYDLDLNLNPYIDFGDTCSNVRQIYIKECNSSFVTIPTSPPTTTTPTPTTTTTKITTTAITTKSPSYCPSISECVGCPINYPDPSITQNGTIVGENLCTIILNWNWPYNEADGVTNVRNNFICRYENLDHCQPSREDVCASCETFKIGNIKTNLNPVIEFSDTCGNMKTVPISSDCYP